MTEAKEPYGAKEERAIVRHQDSALDIYGSGEDIKRMAERIRLCLPNGDKLSLAEALALAQLSVAYGLNPFNGETWYLPGKGTQVGIKGLRKAARKQALYWIEHVLLAPDERKELRIPDNAIAYKALCYRSDMIMQSAQAIRMMYEASMKDAANRYAYKPAVGIGYFVLGEASKMKPDQAARKRAESEALKVAFDLPFASEIGNGDRVGYIDAEDWEVLPGPTACNVDQERTKMVERGVETNAMPVPQPELEQPSPTAHTQRPLPAETIRKTVRARAGWPNGTRLVEGEPLTTGQGTALVSLLGEATTRPGLTQTDIDHARHNILAYLFGDAASSAKALTKREASAVIDWLKEPGEGWELNEYAKAEAAAVLAARLVEQGQVALFPEV